MNSFVLFNKKNIDELLELLKKITGKKFFQNVLIVVSGTILAKGIGILFSPIITRIYGPEVYGIFGAFMAYVSMVTPFAALSYPIAIVLPKSDRESIGIIQLSLFVSIFIFTILFAVLFVGGDSLINLIGAEELGWLIYILPLNILFISWVQISEQWLIRKKKFKQTASILAIHSFIKEASKTGLGYLSPIAFILIVVTTISTFVHAGLMAVFGGLKVRLKLTFKEFQKLKRIAKKYYDFAVFRTPEAFLSSFSKGMPVVLLMSYIGPSAAGFYTISKMALKTPSSLILKSIGDVFYPRFSEAYNNKEDLYSLLIKPIIGIALVTIIPFLIVIIYGKWIFGFVFGSEWVISGEYARWLSIWLFFAVSAAPATRAVAVLKIQGKYLIYRIVYVLLSIIGLFIGLHFYQDDVLAIALYSVTSGLMNILLIFYVIRICKNINNRTKGILK